MPGLASKPIIDIMVVTEQYAKLRTDLQPLRRLGYRHNPTYFVDDPDHLFLGRNTNGQRTEHLHLFHPRSPWPQLDRDFRDYLIAHPGEAHRYAQAKRIAAAAEPNSRKEYSHAKEPLLRELLARAQAWASTRTSGEP